MKANRYIAQLLILLRHASSVRSLVVRTTSPVQPSLELCQRPSLVQPLSASVSNDSVEAEYIPDENEGDDDEWLPDREKARRARGMKKANVVPPFTSQTSSTTTNNYSTNTNDIKPTKKRLTYTEEEEELIDVLGGKDKDNPSSKREPGFLGDCTLKEIALDYQVPICYLADALCGWGVPPPIDTDAMLGDLCTGEMAFAILEAIHTLDVGAINEMYGNTDLMTLCDEYDIELADGFDYAMKKGWNLPFGVRTVLRVEQEDDLIETLAKDVY